MHGEGKAKKSRRDGGGEVGDGARAGVRLETDGHPWSARLPSCAPCLCVREGRRSFGTRLNRSHSPRHGRLRGQQAAGRPHQWHGHAGCTWQHCVTNGGGCPAAVSMRPPKEHAGRPRTCSARRKSTDRTVNPVELSSLWWPKRSCRRPARMLPSRFRPFSCAAVCRRRDRRVRTGPCHRLHSRAACSSRRTTRSCCLHPACPRGSRLRHSGRPCPSRTGRARASERSAGALPSRRAALRAAARAPWG